MKLWPWSKREPERRESIPFTDAVVAALAAQAGGTAIAGDAGAIAALARLRQLGMSFGDFRGFLTL